MELQPFGKPYIDSFGKPATAKSTDGPIFELQQILGRKTARRSGFQVHRITAVRPSACQPFGAGSARRGCLAEAAVDLAASSRVVAAGRSTAIAVGR